MHQPMTSSAEAAPAGSAAIFASGPEGCEPARWGDGRGQGEVRGTRRPRTLKVKGTEGVEQAVAKETSPAASLGDGSGGGRGGLDAVTSPPRRRAVGFRGDARVRARVSCSSAQALGVLLGAAQTLGKPGSATRAALAESGGSSRL